LRFARAVPGERQARQAEIEQAYRDYLDDAKQFLTRARNTRAMLHIGYRLPDAMLATPDGYIAHSERQIDQIRRRVLDGERIPHAEKVFPISQPHTECTSLRKGRRAGGAGLRVNLREDQPVFSHHHRVMEETTDDQIAMPVLTETCARSPAEHSASMDKGFHSTANKTAIAELVTLPVEPKKRKCSPARERLQTPLGSRSPARHGG
jgi:hypothetical protein